MAYSGEQIAAGIGRQACGTLVIRVGETRGCSRVGKEMGSVKQGTRSSDRRSLAARDGEREGRWENEGGVSWGSEQGYRRSVVMEWRARRRGEGWQ